MAYFYFDSLSHPAGDSGFLGQINAVTSGIEPIITRPIKYTSHRMTILDFILLIADSVSQRNRLWEFFLWEYFFAMITR